MMFSLEGKVAIVTGAMRGMGAAHARVLAAQGAKVVITDLDSEQCQTVVGEIIASGGEASCHKMDVTNAEEIDKVFTEVIEKYGKLDILVNNAGIFKAKMALEMTAEEWDQTMSVNAKGEFLCAQRAAKEMMKNKSGKIINIASVASGQVGFGLMGASHYVASKGAIIGMTESLAIEWAQYGINVNAVAPGMIDTPMVDAAELGEDALKAMLSEVPLGRIGKPEEVSAMVAFLASDEASYITGATFHVDGGWLAT